MRLCTPNLYPKFPCSATFFLASVVFCSSFPATNSQTVEPFRSGLLPAPHRVDLARFLLCLGRSVIPCQTGHEAGFSLVRSVVPYDTVRHPHISPASLLLRSLTVPFDLGGVGYSTYASKCILAVFDPKIRTIQSGNC